MYSFNIYVDYPHGEFKLIDRYYCFAENRENATAEAKEYAQNTYPNENVSVLATN